MARVNGNARREPPDKGREATTAGKGHGNAAAKSDQGKIFHRVKDLRQAVKKGRQFEIRKLCRRVKEAEKRSANLAAAAAAAAVATVAGTPISRSSRGEGTTVNPNSRPGSVNQENDKKVLGIATAARRQLEKLKQKLAALKAVAVDDVVKHACISAGLPACQAEDLVIQLQKCIERLEGGGHQQPETTAKFNSDEEEFGDNPSVRRGGVADGGAECKWAMERLVNTKCVEDELLLLRDSMAHPDGEVMEEIKAEWSKGQKRKVLDEEESDGMEGEAQAGKVSLKRKKVAKGNSCPSDAEGIDDPESRGLPHEQEAEQRRKKPKEDESDSDVEGMDREMAGRAIMKLQSVTLARRLQKSQRKVLNSKAEEEVREEEEEREGKEDSETSSDVISASEAGESGESEGDGSSEEETRSSEEDGSDGFAREGSGEDQSEDEGDEFFRSNDDEMDGDVAEGDLKPRHKALGKGDHMCNEEVQSVNLGGRKASGGTGEDDEMDLDRDRRSAKRVVSKEKNWKNGEGRISERMPGMDRRGREQRQKEPSEREGRGNGKELQDRKAGGKLKAQLETKLKKRLHRMTKAGGNRLGQRERRRLAEMILGAKARHLAETSIPVGQMQYRQPCRPTSGGEVSSIKGTKSNGTRGAAGLSYAQGARGKTGRRSGSITGGRKAGRLEAPSGKGGGFVAHRGSAAAQQKSQMVGSGAKGQHHSSKNSEHNTKDEKGFKKLHPSWIAKIEQQKKAAQLNVASGKKIKFDDDDD